MKYFLDTNICVYALHSNPPEVVARLRAVSPDDVAVSAITAAELRCGAAKSQHAKKNHRVLDVFLGQLTIVPFDDAAALVYGEIRATLEKRGKPIGDLDLLIAASALSRRATLVTNNLREFQRVPRLVCQNWAAT